jgi:xylan 1,4-beta-xylosidase
MPFNRDMMAGVFAKARSQVPSGVPLFYTEFNDGLYGDPPYHDTSFAASYIAKTIADGQGVVQMASWWTFSDIFEEAGFGYIPFGRSLSYLHMNTV